MTGCSCHTNYPRALAASNIHQFKHIFKYYAQCPQQLGFFQKAPHTLCALQKDQEDISVSRKHAEQNQGTGKAQFSKVWDFLNLYFRNK